MHVMCWRQAPCRMKYQPVKIRTVLMKLNEAFNAGRSEMENTSEGLKATIFSGNARPKFRRSQRALPRWPGWISHFENARAFDRQPAARIFHRTFRESPCRPPRQ